MSRLITKDGLCVAIYEGTANNPTDHAYALAVLLPSGELKLFKTVKQSVGHLRKLGFIEGIKEIEETFKDLIV